LPSSLIGEGLLRVNLARGNLAARFSQEMGALQGVAVAESGRFGNVLAQGLKVAAFGALATGVAMVAVGGISLKMASDFQASMTQLVTGAGESEENLKLVRSGILAMAGQTGESAQQLAAGMYLVESAGFHGAQGLMVLRSAAEGARVGNADMATVADAVTSALNAYSQGAGSATAVTSMLVEAVAQGKMHMQDLAGALGTVLPTAAAAGVGLDQVLAAISTMTSQGDAPADAATHLRFALLALIGPTGAASKEMQKVGLTADEVAKTLMTQGLPAALALIQSHIDKTFGKGSPAALAALKTIGGGVRGMATELEIGGKHMGTFNENVAAISAAGRGAGKDVQGWARVQSDLNFKLDKATAAAGAAAIKLGTKLLPYAGQLLDAVTPLIPVVGGFASALIDKAVPAVEGMVKSVRSAVGWVDQHKHGLALAATVIAVLLTPAIIGWSVVMSTRLYVAILKTIAGMRGLATSSLINYTRIGLSTVATIAHATAMGVVRVATLLWTGVQWLLNAALTANPIGLVIVGIALLVAGVIWAYKNVGWFHSGVDKLWGFLKRFTPWLTDFLIAAWNDLTAAVSWAWDGFKKLGGWLEDTFGPILKAIGDGLSKVGGFLDFINPFARHSPSLVDQVREGTRLIAAHYGGMADAIEDHARRGQLALVALTGVAPAAGGGGLAGGGAGSLKTVLTDAFREALRPTGTAAVGGAAKQEFNFYGDVKPDQGIALGRDIGWQLKGSPR